MFTISLSLSLSASFCLKEMGKMIRKLASSMEWGNSEQRQVQGDPETRNTSSVTVESLSCLIFLVGLSTLTRKAQQNNQDRCLISKKFKVYYVYICIQYKSCIQYRHHKVGLRIRSCSGLLCPEFEFIKKNSASLA